MRRENPWHQNFEDVKLQFVVMWHKRQDGQKEQNHRKKAEKKIWGGMNSHVAKLTKRLIPETLGFGPHAIRHLVATDWLRKYSNDYITVACLLNDKLETVINNYAHLKQDDSFERYESYMLTLINGSGHQI